MDKDQNKNTCYVFSPNTLAIAMQDWLSSMIESDKNKEEQFKITIEALPWFLEHIQENASIYMFTQDDLMEALKTWKMIQIEHYANQKNRIEETCDLIISFFDSEAIRTHKMIVDA